ncbi:MAG: hypothetical protein QOI59_2073 [Gammaproteobacteria bacterium]|jgi:hypothetical protein|nr:hypothetical protein [Gammaproteobacteria bacterium]
MPIVRAREILLAGMAAGMLAGCGVTRLEQSPSKMVDLSGSWILDPAASDDPKPLLEKLRPKPVSRRWGDNLPDDGTGDDTGPPSGGGQQGGGQRGGGRGRRGGQSQPDLAYRNNNDAYTHTTVLKMLQADLARARNLTIRQSPEQFSLDYGSTVRSFTPGSISVVSASWGVADQSSGWKGRDFVIQVKPQMGVASYEKFSLAEDGKRLTEELSLGGGEFPSVKLKRVYDHTDRPLPRAVPNNE